MMEAPEGAEVRGRRKTDRLAAEAAGSAGNIARGPTLTGTSYWLDVWLMILFDLALFVFIYMLP